jgi:hypothetical protein
MSLSDLTAFGLVAGVAVLASLFFLFLQTRQMAGQVRQTENKYPSAPLFQDHLEVIIRVNDWISEGNRGEDVPPREEFLKMPSRTIDSLVDQLGYFGYTGAIRKLYLKNETRINHVLHRTSPNSEERNTAMNGILAEVFIDLARQANIKIPQANLG